MGQVSGLGAGGSEPSWVAGLALPCRPPTRCGIELFSSSLFRLSPGNYRTQLYDKQREEYQPATPGLGMFVEVKDPEDKVSWPCVEQAPGYFVSFRICLSEKDGDVGRCQIFIRSLGRVCWTGGCSQLLSDCCVFPSQLLALIQLVKWKFTYFILVICGLIVVMDIQKLLILKLLLKPEFHKTEHLPKRSTF